MDGHGVRELLQEVADGRMTVDDAVLKLKQQPFEDLGFAKVDLHRGLRQGVPEVIFGAGKTPEQITSIAERMLQRGETSVLITRMSPEAADIVSQSIDIRYDPVSRIGVAGRITEERVGKITVMTAGTSDIPVAEEAAQTAASSSPSQAWRAHSQASSAAWPTARSSRCPPASATVRRSEVCPHCSRCSTRAPAGCPW